VPPNLFKDLKVAVNQKRLKKHWATAYRDINSRVVSKRPTI
jgi:hypothetical protein